ncbi:MAG: glycosyltransferase family 4 protein [Ferruginibacter sp.]
MKKKIAFIIQRYGKEVNGGSEVLARMMAEKLIKEYDVTVLTSRAVDYNTWQPVLPKGISFENGVRIMRFDHPVKDSEKKIHHDNRRQRGRFLYQKLYRALNKPSWYIKLFPNAEMKPVPDTKWLEVQGPATYDLIEYVKKNKDDYDVFICFTYVYFPTVISLQEVANKSIFIPTMHDEEPAHRPVFKRIMRLPAFILFLTEAERRFSLKTFNIDHIPNRVVSVGIDIPEEIEDHKQIEKFEINKKYIIYAGRIEKHKGCDLLIKYFVNYVNTNPNIVLVLVGRNSMQEVKHPLIKYAGFVSDEEKERLIKHAEALVIPSKHESLSLVVLESFACKIPVIANGESEVLKDHIDSSNGGWTYESEQEFVHVLNEVMEGKENEQKGLNGYEYVTKNYSWQKAIDIFDDAINFVNDSNKEKLKGKL